MVAQSCVVQLQDVSGGRIHRADVVTSTINTSYLDTRDIHDIPHLPVEMICTLL
jgi:hypothetical protein